MAPAPLRIGFIGDGSIAHSVRECLLDAAELAYETVAILGRCAPAQCGGATVGSVEDLIARSPDIVVECAGHRAVGDYGEAILTAGIPLLIVSIGALADDALRMRLLDCAQLGATRVILAPGAMAGIDALAAARLGGLDRVRYTGRKPPLAWAGTPAEDMHDLSSLRVPTTFYTGSAREAALNYPKNSNVAATVALAGIGFDRTEVELIADPTIAKNVHELKFEGADGKFEIRIFGEPSRNNSKTSALTAHSVARILTGMSAPLSI